ncbi:MAG TPA: GNAT family N-acetyltransferase [Dongiaceae bacterium]|nr:GNAT family N-acetyltransferase [Dongiaceae bacterium]
MIVYGVEPDLTAADFVNVLRRSGLAARRPVDDPARIARMVEHGNLVVAARDGDGLLVGVARSLTDFSFCCYLSDLAVDERFQGRGIGRELIRRTRAAAGPDATLILLSAPGAQSYYPHVGFEKADNCWIMRRES